MMSMETDIRTWGFPVVDLEMGILIGTSTITSLGFRKFWGKSKRVRISLIGRNSYNGSSTLFSGLYQGEDEHQK